MSTPEDVGSAALWLFTLSLVAVLFLVAGAVGLRRSPVAIRVLGSSRWSGASRPGRAPDRGDRHAFGGVAAPSRPSNGSLEPDAPARSNGRPLTPLADHPQGMAGTTSRPPTVLPRSDTPARSNGRPVAPVADRPSPGVPATASAALPVEAPAVTPASAPAAAPSVEEREVVLVGHWADLVARVAGETGVNPKVINQDAGRIAARVEEVEQEAVAAEAEARLTARLACWCFCGIPLGVVLIPLLLGEGLVIRSGLGWLVAAAAAAVTVVGARWTSSLATTEPRLLAARKRDISARLSWADEVAGSLETAQLYAAAGWTGPRALRAATPDSPEHPLRLALDEWTASAGNGSHLAVAGEASADERVSDEDQDELAAFVRSLDRIPDAAAAAERFERISAALRAQQRRDHRAQVNLVSLRALGPFLACFVPAAALILALNLT